MWTTWWPALSRIERSRSKLLSKRILNPRKPSKQVLQMDLQSSNRHMFRLVWRLHPSQRNQSWTKLTTCSGIKMGRHSLRGLVTSTVSLSKSRTSRIAPSFCLITPLRLQSIGARIPNFSSVPLRLQFSSGIVRIARSQLHVHNSDVESWRTPSCSCTLQMIRLLKAPRTY